MPILEKEVKLLWGRAAGICSNPGCRQKVSATSEDGSSYLTGEMAHMVAKHLGGPRANSQMGADIYENLILLCPTCHTKVDKAPADFPLDLLADWKRAHEKWVDDSLAGPGFETVEKMLAAIEGMLSENYHYFAEYGPRSRRAEENPESSAHAIWMARRLDVIIQNNRRILNILEANESFLDGPLKVEAIRFRDHGLAYEQHAYDRLDDYPTFPTSFADLVRERLSK